MIFKWIIILISLTFGFQFAISNRQFCSSPYERNSRIIHINCTSNQNNFTIINTTYSYNFTNNCGAVIECNDGYSFEHGNRFETRCVSGSWEPEVPMCRKICKRLEPLNAILHCYDGNSNKEIPCNNTLVSGTRVMHNCRLNYSPETQINYHEITCSEEGEWDLPLLRCMADCGVAHPKIQTLISNGREEAVGAAPWHVAIYDITKTENTLICGGTIISEHIIVSAAHCFFDHTKQIARNESDYEIVLGKRTRDYNLIDNMFQKTLKIKKIYFNKRGFYGIVTNYATDIALIVTSTKIEYSEFVLPACVDWFSSNSKFQEKSYGKVSGWGLNENQTLNAVLYTTDLEYINYEKCIQELPNDYKAYVLYDKFCAKNASDSIVQVGDSGGGFLLYDAHYSSYFLQGIVSAHIFPSGVPLALFTDISHYIIWIKTIKSEVENKFRQSEKLITSASNCFLPDGVNIAVDYVQCESKNFTLSNGFKEIPHLCMISTTCVYKKNWFENLTFSFSCVNGNWQPPITNCPNITESAAIRPKYDDSWCSKRATYAWFKEVKGRIPKCTLQAGVDLDGSILYAGRVFHEGNILPAKVRANSEKKKISGIAYITYNEIEISKQEFEVLCILCGGKAAWIAHNCSCEGVAPPNAIEVGITNLGEKLYMGRVNHQSSLTPGKVTFNNGKGYIYIPFNWAEKRYRKFEVLVLDEEH